MLNITGPTWKALQAHYDAFNGQQMRELFAQDSERFSKFSVQYENILLDYSKNRITEETMTLLMTLARDAGLEDWISRMFNAEHINHTEKRAVLHTALRQRSADAVMLDGQDVMPEIRAELYKIRELAEAVRQRKWRGASGQPITDVINIGIGGSSLGPEMVTDALRPYGIHDMRFHFVSNVDENHIMDTLELLKAETSLFIISSKSFTTQDTMLNASTARKWFLKSIDGESAINKHFVAVTANTSAAIEFGIDEKNVFKMWDWVGGRYSLWSAIGLPIAISIGMDHFEAMLEGANEMDKHFKTQPFEKNIPVLLALLGIWYNNFCGAQTQAILPYDQHLRRLPAYLQQADMESNGKYVDRNGEAVDYETGPVIFGEIGIAAQHAFYQLLHQGSKLIPADFLASISDFHCIREHHRVLMSNVFAQTEALMKGKSSAEAEAELQKQGLSEEEIKQLLPYKIFPGNKPTNTILFRTLDPHTMGMLIAMYEHKIFVQGVIWDINSFDQWGVELGKELAMNIQSELDDNKPVTEHDSSTNGLINFYKVMRPKNN
ncbi:Glucose-6-phosphate isomerase [hydrothermal vent metagenome]|uniref:glucose-6-phosphate isomerase n=1 Tax=hydrothermal vent metagenome TaxID=652676 RepID=A0A3B1B1M8_9ZZZZ